MSNEYDGVEILEYAQELRILNYCAFLLLFLWWSSDKISCFYEIIRQIIQINLHYQKKKR